MLVTDSQHMSFSKLVTEGYSLPITLSSLSIIPGVQDLGQFDYKQPFESQVFKTYNLFWYDLGLEFKSYSYCCQLTYNCSSHIFKSDSWDDLGLFYYLIFPIYLDC